MAIIAVAGEPFIPSLANFLANAAAEYAGTMGEAKNMSANLKNLTLCFDKNISGVSKAYNLS
jgi:hypothetical protein